MVYQKQQRHDPIGKALALSCLHSMNLQLAPTQISKHMEVIQYRSFSMSVRNAALTLLKIEDCIQKCFEWGIVELGQKSQIISSLVLVVASRVLKRRNLMIL